MTMPRTSFRPHAKGLIRHLAPSLMVCLLAVPSVVSAASPKDSDEEEIINHALDLRRAGKDAEALVELRQLHARTQSTKSLAQIGLAEFALGRWVDAEEHLRDALASPDPWIKRNLKTLKEAEASIRSHLGDLEILGSPIGAEVLGEGRSLGRLPMPKPVRMTAGVVSVQLKAPGYLPAVRTITVSPGTLVRETIDLQPLETASPPAPTSEQSGSASAPAARRTGDAEPTEPSSRWQRPAAFIAGGAAVLAAGAAVTGWIVYKHKDDDFRQQSCSTSGSAVSGPNPALCSDIANSRRTAGVVAVVGAATAGVLGATAALLFLLDDGSSKAPTNGNDVALVVLPSGVGATFQLRF